MTFSILSMVKRVAPLIGTAIGGPFGGLATAAINTVLGLDEDTPEKDTLKELSKNPDAVLKLREAEIKFKLRIKQLEIKESELVFKDIESAREREMILQDVTPALLAGGITFGFFTLLGLFIFVSIPPSSATLLNVMLGSLGTAFIQVVSYYFGSSLGSDKKNTIIKDLR